MKTRKKWAKRKRKQKLIAVAILLFFVSIVTFLALYRSNPGKIPAEEYFEISDYIEPWGFTHENGTVLELLSLAFKLTAVGGDAHSIVITAGIYSNEMIEIINQGESKEVNLVFSPRWFGHKLEKEGFLVELNISSQEAKGILKVHIPPEWVIPR